MILPIIQVIEILNNRIDFNKINTVLDLGCGSFYNKSFDLFPERDVLSVFTGKNITAYDIFEKDIEWRKEYGPLGNYSCMDILDVDIKERHDVIICHHVLEHLTQKDHDEMFKRIDSANCKYIILGGPVGYSDNSVFVKIKENKYEEHKIGLDPEFYNNNGYEIYNFGPSFLAIKEK